MVFEFGFYGVEFVVDVFLLGFLFGENEGMVDVMVFDEVVGEGNFEFVWYYLCVGGSSFWDGNDGVDFFDVFFFENFFEFVC